MGGREHAAFTADPHVITLAAMRPREPIGFTADPHVIIRFRGLVRIATPWIHRHGFMHPAAILKLGICDIFDFD
jgi:hypothetical protein